MIKIAEDKERKDELAKDTAKGEKDKEMVECTECNGEGHIDCEQCSGSGEEDCDNCNGEGEVEE